MMGEWLVDAVVLRPYYAPAFAALSITEEAIENMAVNERYQLIIDPGWASGLSREHRAHYLVHMVEHVLRRHKQRGAPWACACMEINDEVDADDLPPHPRPADYGMADGHTAEEYAMRVPVDMPALCRDDVAFPAGGMAPGDADRVAATVAEEVRAHVLRAPGSVPDAIRVWAEAELKPVRHPWHRDLPRVVAHRLRGAAVTHGDVGRARISRRWRETTPLRFTGRKPRPRVGLVVDTSGSMQSFSHVVSIVHSLARACGDVMVAQGDAAVAAPPTRRIPAEWFGGGGTNMGAVMAALTGKVDCMVVITDGDTPWPTWVDVPVVVVLVAGPRAVPDGYSVVVMDTP